MGSADSSSTPSPTRTRAPAGSPASSPQTATGMPAARPGDHRCDRPEDGGVERVLELRERGVRAIGGQDVLRQVIRADAEELDPAGQLGGHEGGRRDLDHDPADELGVVQPIVDQSFLRCRAE